MYISAPTVTTWTVETAGPRPAPATPATAAFVCGWHGHGAEAAGRREAVADAHRRWTQRPLTPAEAENLHDLLTEPHDRLLEAPEGEICAS